MEEISTKLNKNSDSDRLSSNLSRIWRKIGTHGIMVFSTSAESRVTSRPMSVIVLDGKFYCQTDESYLKYKQICQNPNVALSVKKFSIEGKCRNIGHPLDENNRFFAESYKKHFRVSFNAYSALPTEILFEITPTLIYSWEYKLTKPFMEFFDFENELYHIEEK